MGTEIFLQICSFFIVAFLIIFLIRPFYCFIFEHKEWEDWECWLHRSDEFEYQYTNCYGDKKFVNRFDKNIVAYIWADGYSSIHNERNKKNSVLVGYFDKTHSKRMAKLLSYRITKEITLDEWVRKNLA